MKYQIPVTRTDTDVIEVEAENHDEAYKKALGSQKVEIEGFETHGEVIKITAEPGQEEPNVFTLYGACENCEKRFWGENGEEPTEETVTDDEGVTLCNKCWDACTESAPRDSERSEG